MQHSPKYSRSPVLWFPGPCSPGPVFAVSLKLYTSFYTLGLHCVIPWSYHGIFTLILYLVQSGWWVVFPGRCKSILLLTWEMLQCSRPIRITESHYHGYVDLSYGFTSGIWICNPYFLGRKCSNPRKVANQLVLWSKWYLKSRKPTKATMAIVSMSWSASILPCYINPDRQ